MQISRLLFKLSAWLFQAAINNIPLEGTIVWIVKSLGNPFKETLHQGPIPYMSLIASKDNYESITVPVDVPSIGTVIPNGVNLID